MLELVYSDSVILSQYNNRHTSKITVREIGHKRSLGEHYKKKKNDRRADVFLFEFRTETR